MTKIVLDPEQRLWQNWKIFTVKIIGNVFCVLLVTPKKDVQVLAIHLPKAFETFLGDYFWPSWIRIRIWIHWLNWIRMQSGSGSVSPGYRCQNDADPTGSGSTTLRGGTYNWWLYKSIKALRTAPVLALRYFRIWRFFLAWIYSRKKRQEAYQYDNTSVPESESTSFLGPPDPDHQAKIVWNHLTSTVFWLIYDFYPWRMM